MKRGGPLRRTTRLAPVSAKALRTRRARRAAVAERLRLCGGRCEALGLFVECWGVLQPHEPLTRARGGSITDPFNIRMVCAAHHAWIHDHPVLATRAGLLIATEVGR